MSDVERPYQAAADWLLTHEAPGAREAAELSAAAERVCHRLGAVLGDIIGDQGYAAILARAQHLAQPMHPWLGELAHGGEGECLGGLAAVVAGQTLLEAHDGLADLFANALQVLSSLITPEIALGQVERAWPELPRLIVQAAVREEER